MAFEIENGVVSQFVLRKKMHFVSEEHVESFFRLYIV